MVREGGEWLNTIHITHQTGAADFQRIQEAYGSSLSTAPVDLRDYLHDMGQQYAKADLVICRSGTGTLSELAACGKAAVLVPFPFAADDHQRKNAESLVNKGAALMILHKDLNPQSLRSVIERLQNNPEERSRLRENIRKFHQPKAAQALVSEFLERMPKHASC